MFKKKSKEINVTFKQGDIDLLSLVADNAEEQGLSLVKEKLRELLTTKNINFLLGAGTSTPFIPVMQDIQEKIKESENMTDDLNELYDSLLRCESVEKCKSAPKCVSVEQCKFTEKCASVEQCKSAKRCESAQKCKFIANNFNLEEILAILFSMEGAQKLLGTENKGIVDKSQELKEEIIKKILENVKGGRKGENEKDPNFKKTLKIYKKFYQKVALRNKDLARVNVFTTNYDLLNEKAMDEEGINYNNGFGGGLLRTFNPARFTFTLSRKMDMNLEKFEPLENMVYLYKLHGSVNWIKKDKHSLFDIEEVHEGYKTKKYDEVLIYPTPHKQGESLGRPYSDLLREFQHKLGLPHSVLFVIGYSFSDDHIDNIIYQALKANASLSVFVFGNHETKCKLWNISDSRIYWLYDNDLEEKLKQKEETIIHYFEYIVDHLIPESFENENKKFLEDFVKALKERIR